jgi:radical SAM additional 4Fe4S-binding domain
MIFKYSLKGAFNLYKYQYNLKSIYVEITNNCNFKCKSCYNDSGNGKKHYLELDEFNKMIDSAAANTHKCTLYLSGGEPLLHPQIWDMIAYAQKKNFDVLIVTNGSLITQEILEKIISFNVALQISLDGYDEQTNDAVRGIGSFKKTYLALKQICNNQYSDKVKIRCTLNQENFHDLEKYILLAKELNISDISYGWMAPLGRGSMTFEEIGIDEKHYFHLFKEVDRICELYETPVFKVGRMELINCCPMISGEGVSIDLNIRIDVFGNVYLCQRMSTLESSLGNIKDLLLNDILNSDKLQMLISRLYERKKMMLPQCNSCFINKVCDRGCPGLALLTGGLECTDSFCFPRKQLLSDILNHSREATKV